MQHGVVFFDIYIDRIVSRSLGPSFIKLIRAYIYMTIRPRILEKSVDRNSKNHSMKFMLSHPKRVNLLGCTEQIRRSGAAARSLTVYII
jgi:hypothetical protein